MRVSRRETCIWVTPMRSAISRWVRPSQNRIARIWRSRSPSRRSTGRRMTRPRRRLRLVVARQQVAQGGAAVGSDGVVEGGGDEAAVAGQRLDHVLGALLEVVGDLGRLGGTAESVGQLALGGVDARLELLDPPRRPDHPAVVTEVLAQLAADGGDGVGEEVVAAADVVPSCGLGQCQRSHLAQVVERDAAGAVADASAWARSTCSTITVSSSWAAPPRRWPRRPAGTDHACARCGHDGRGVGSLGLDCSGHRSPTWD